MDKPVTVDNPIPDLSLVVPCYNEASHLESSVAILLKVLWFFHQPLLNALNLTKLSPKRRLAWSVAAFITPGLLLHFRGTLKQRLVQLTIAFLLLPLSYLPNLVVAESSAFYRTQSALTFLIVVYIFLALWGYRRVFDWPAAAMSLTAVVGLAALTSSLLAAHNVRAYFAVPQAQELELMRGYLTQRESARVSRIHIIRYTWKDSIAPTVRYDEFGLPSSAQPWAPGSMAYLVLREVNPEHASIPIEVAAAEDATRVESDDLVVDMRQLLSLGSPMHLDKQRR